MRVLRIPQKLILIVLAAKLVVLITPLLSFYLSPFQDIKIYSQDNFIYPPFAELTWEEAYKTWDAHHYLYLADHGYRPEHPSNAFLPLFPLCIKALSWATHGSPWIIGLIVSNLFSLGAFIALFCFVEDLFDGDTAFRTVIYTLVFPTGFYYTLIYSESLFLLLVVLTFIAMYSGKYWAATLFAFLVPLTRGIGVFLTIPLLVFGFCPGQGVQKLKVVDWRIKLVWAAPLLGFASSLIIMKIFTNNFFEHFDAQSKYIAEASLDKFLNLPAWLIDNFNLFRLKWYDTRYGLFDRLFFIFYVYLVWRVIRSQDRTLSCYALFFGLIPAVATSLWSFSRYLIVVFPVFIQMASLRGFNHRRIWLMMLLCQFALIWTHARGGWVA